MRRLQWLSASTHLLLFFRVRQRISLVRRVKVNTSLKYVNVVCHYIDATTLYVEFIFLLYVNSQLLLLTCRHCYFTVSTHFLSMSTCLHFCINLLSLIVKSCVNTSSKWVDLLGILHLTVSRHTTCVSVCFQHILQTVLTHDKYVSTYLWNFWLACQQCLHTCRPIFEIFD